MKKQWKRLAALSSAAVMAAGTLLYFPTDTLQNISWGITASAEETGTETWNEDNLTWTLSADGTTMTISGTGAMKEYYGSDNSPPYYNYKMIDCQVKCNTIREKNFEAPRRESEN